MNNKKQKFELGDLVRYTQGSTNLYNSWWGYVAESKRQRRQDNVYIYWFSADLPHFVPFFSITGLSPTSRGWFLITWSNGTRGQWPHHHLQRIARAHNERS